jgi:hypothetical protein
VVHDPERRDDKEARRVNEQGGRDLPEPSYSVRRGYPQIEHEHRQDNRKDAVAEEFEPVLGHLPHQPL